MANDDAAVLAAIATLRADMQRTDGTIFSKLDHIKADVSRINGSIIAHGIKIASLEDNSEKVGRRMFAIFMSIFGSVVAAIVTGIVLFIGG